MSFCLKLLLLERICSGRCSRLQEWWRGIVNGKSILWLEQECKKQSRRDTKSKRSKMKSRGEYTHNSLFSGRDEKGMRERKKTAQQQQCSYLVSIVSATRRKRLHNKGRRGEWPRDCTWKRAEVEGGSEGGERKREKSSTTAAAGFHRLFLLFSLVGFGVVLSFFFFFAFYLSFSIFGVEGVLMPFVYLFFWPLSSELRSTQQKEKGKNILADKERKKRKEKREKRRRRRRRLCTVSLGETKKKRE